VFFLARCVLAFFKSRLHGQVELLALHDLGPVDVEKVGVQDGLHEAGDDGDGVEEALHCVSAKERVSINSPDLGLLFCHIIVESGRNTHLQIQLGM
jgi:hypothetical protein